MALIILQKSTFPDIRDSAPKVWFGRAACTKRQDPLAGHKIPPPLFIRVGRTADEYAIIPSWAVSVSDAEMLLYACCECNPQQFLTKKGGGPSKEDPSPLCCLFAQDAFEA